MSIFPHVLTGAAVGSFMPNVGIAIVAGFVSHIGLDLIPHWDPALTEKKQPQWRRFLYVFLLLVDFSLGLTVLWLVREYPIMFWGGLIGGIVDLDSFFFQKLKHIGIKIHDDTSNWHKQTNMFLGLFNQGIVSLLMMIVLYHQLYGLTF